MEKFIFAITTLILCVFLSSPLISVTVLALNSLILIYKAKIKPDCYLKLMTIPFYFLIVGTVTILFTSITPDIKAIFSFNIFYFELGITSNSLDQAANVFLKALASVSCLYFLVLTTPLTDIIHVLRKLKLPELFLELMELIYRLIFILLETAQKIYNSQNSRLGYSSLKNSFKSLGYLISNLFTLSFHRANQLFISLESRGYSGSINVLENEWKISLKNIFLILFAEIGLITMFIATKYF
ncbi:MAG: cobalt ECF transporter T component CbiQ [Bacillus subtilis]|nr:cobalt ECF transporter T component CbiQ [Bacillus subtilis]